MAYKKMTVEERREAAKAKAEGLRGEIAGAVEALRDSDAWHDMLQMAGRFHSYSYRNLLLILSQMPEATQVAGFQAWRKLGRQVRKGERGIKIFGFSKVKVDPEDESDDAVMRTVFPVVTVFDISQTDEIPGGGWVDASVTRLLEGEDEAGIIEPLRAWLEGEGWTVEVGDCQGANGYTRHTSRLIRLQDGLSPAQHAKTLIHEAAHALLHGEIDDYQEHRGVYETEAESVAYSVAGALGMDTSNYSIGYVAGWSKADRELIEGTAANVMRAVKILLDALI